MPQFIGARHFRYDRTGCRPTHSSSLKVLRDSGTFSRRVHHNGGSVVNQPAPVGILFSSSAMSADDQDLFGAPAIGKRNFQAGGRRKSRRDAGYNLDLDACLFQNIQFFSRTAKNQGSPLLRRTTMCPRVAYRIRSSLISSCVMLFCPHLLPIFTTLACEEISVKTSADTRASCRTTPARPRIRTARTVSRSGLPGPATPALQAPARWFVARGHGKSA